MALSPKHQRFVAEYLVDLNATQAAIRAGYSAKTARQQGARLLSNASISAALREANEKRQRKVELSAEYVLSNLMEVTERCMQRAPVMARVDGEMVQVVDEEGRHVWQFDSKGANTALGLLGKHLKLFTDKIEAKIDGLTDEERARRAAELVLGALGRKQR